MGFSGNLSNLGTLGNSSTPSPARHVRFRRPRGAREPDRRDPAGARGVKYFYHPEQDNYRFFADPAHPELDTVHRIQWVMENTDPKLFGWQIDVLHNWSGRVRFLNATTHQPDISVWALAQARAAARNGLAYQGRLPEHGPAGNLDGRPAGERRRAVLPDVPAHADVHGRGRSPARATSAPGPARHIPNADPDCPGFKFMFENLKGDQKHATTSSRATAAPARDRPERRPGPVASPREGVRGCPAGLARRKIAAGSTRFRTAGLADSSAVPAETSAVAEPRVGLRSVPSRSRRSCSPRTRSRPTPSFLSAHPSDGGGAGIVTVGTVGGGPVGLGPGSGLSQVAQSRSPTPVTRRNILIKVRSASGYFRPLGCSAGSRPFGCGSMLRG